MTATVPDRQIGVDIGGTGIKAGLVNPALAAIQGTTHRQPTPQPATPHDIGDAVAELVENLEAEHDQAVRSPIGIAFPGIVQNGVSRSAANVDDAFINFNIQAFFTERLRRPVNVINDADAAGLAEARFGAGQGIRGTVLVITLGTGIGSALVHNGQLVPNAELGHLSIDGLSAEARASAVARERDGLSWEEYSVRLQSYFSQLEFIFSPELIIIGGGISARTADYLPHLQLRTPITAALLQNEAGIIGAAMQAPTPTHHPPQPTGNFGNVHDRGQCSILG